MDLIEVRAVTERHTSSVLCNVETQLHQGLVWAIVVSSKGGGTTPPTTDPMTSRSRDVNQHGGGVIDLINMQMTYLICKLPTKCVNYLLNMQMTYLICKLSN